MNLTNYHCHSLYCDGRADMDTFVRFAISKKFTSFGFSSHAPLPFPTHWTMEWDRMNDYLTEFSLLQKKYEKKIELAIGLEIDYIDNINNPANIKFQELPLNYRIGSVHLLPDKNHELVDIDCPPNKFRDIINNHFNGDLDYVVHLYYEQLIKMIEQGGFDIVGHADKIHYNASCFHFNLLNESWYDKLVHDYFDMIANYGYQMEINTKSYRSLNTFYPDIRYFKYLYDKGIKVQVNSDSHYPERINSGRPEALAALKKAGYRKVMEWHHHKWEETFIH